MYKLTQTSVDAEHYHVVLTDFESDATVAESNDHFHEVQVVEELTFNGEVIDPETLPQLQQQYIQSELQKIQQEITSNLSETPYKTQDEIEQELQQVQGQLQQQFKSMLEKTPRLVILPAQDGHTHEIEDEYIPDMSVYETKEKREDVLKEFLEELVAAKELNKEFHENFVEANKFYAGEQWDPEKREELSKNRRATAVVNLTKTHLDRLFDIQRDNRTEIKFFPVTGGDQGVCDIANIVSKVILNNSNFHKVESKAFFDAAVGGRGGYDTRMDYTRDLEGELKVTHEQQTELLFSKYDDDMLGDCECYFKRKAVSVEALKKMYPEHIEEMETFFDMYKNGIDEISFKESFTPPIFSGNDGQARTLALHKGYGDFSDKYGKTSAIIQRQKVEYQASHILYSEDFGVMQECWGWSDEDIKAALTLPTIQKRNRFVPKIRLTIVAGGALVLDTNPYETPNDEMTFIPIHANKIGNKIWGKVHDVMDLQRDYNKRRSQVIDICNNMVAHTWFVSPNTFASPKAFEDFKQYANTPGFVATIREGAVPPQPVAVSPFPSGVAQLMIDDLQTIQTVMNVNITALEEQQGANMMLGIRQAVLGNGYLFEALREAKKKLARHLLWYLQNRYSPKKILSIISDEAKRSDEEFTINGKPYTEYQEEQIQRLLEDADLRTVDVEISETLHSPTMRLATFLALKEMRQQGANIPETLLVEYMDLTEEAKEAMMAQLQEASESQAESQKMTQEMEIYKSAGVIPPNDIANILMETQKLVDEKKLPKGAREAIEKRIFSQSNVNKMNTNI